MIQGVIEGPGFLVGTFKFVVEDMPVDTALALCVQWGDLALLTMLVSNRLHVCHVIRAVISRISALAEK